MICPPDLYYAQPYFHLPDGYAAQFMERIEAGKGTQRDFDLAASFGMFGLEGYFTEAERDAALGQGTSCRSG